MRGEGGTEGDSGGDAGTEGESRGGGVRVGEGGGEERRGEATSQPPPKAARLEIVFPTAENNTENTVCVAVLNNSDEVQGDAEVQGDEEVPGDEEVRGDEEVWCGSGGGVVFSDYNTMLD